MDTELKSDPSLAVTSEVWDRDPFLLGTLDGTVDLRTGKLREPDPADGITRITTVSPAETVDCPRWLQFLEQTFGDAELIGFIKQWGGYCLTGDITEHALVFGFGNGKNGKSVWLNVLVGIMGDYATTAAMETFTASKFDRHPTELAMLRGARLVTERDRGRPLMGREPDQTNHWWGSDHRAVHAEGLLHLPAELQTNHHRKS